MTSGTTELVALLRTTVTAIERVVAAEVQTDASRPILNSVGALVTQIRELLIDIDRLHAPPGAAP